MYNHSNPAEFSSLVDLARWQAENNPDKKVLTFLPNGEEYAIDLSYAELDRRFRTMGAWIQGKLKVGDRAIVMFPSGLDLILGIYGCLYAGVIPVLTTIPRPNASLDPLQATVNDSGALLIITTSDILSSLDARVKQSGLNGVDWLAIDQMPIDISPDEYQQPRLSRETVALLAYTSGSTNLPKGVMYTYEAILNCIDISASYFHLDQETVLVSWIPLYHAAGLLFSFFLIGTGMRLVLMPTQAFMERPARWLEALTRYRATVSASFNFGLQTCLALAASEPRPEYDLSSLKVCLIGGERIRPDLLDEFASQFSNFGFKRNMFVPTYASTELVGFGTGEIKPSGFETYTLEPESLERNEVKLVDPNFPKALHWVGCGKNLPDKRFVFVDPETGKQSLPNRIGELWISCKNMSIGYWNRPQDTLQSFGAYLTDTKDGPFYRTGDLGFMVHNDLVVTGRIKDMVILHGKNYYSQDFENSILPCHPLIVQGGAAAFAIIVDDEERLALTCEIQKDISEMEAAEVFNAIRMAIARDQQQTIHTIALVKKGTLPRTASGKLQRFACRGGLVKGTLDIITVSRQDSHGSASRTIKPGFVAPSTPIERALIGIWISFLKVDQIGVNDNFFELGGDSLIGAQILAQIQEVFQVEIPLGSTFQAPTVASMARLITELRKKNLGG